MAADFYQTERNMARLQDRIGDLDHRHRGWFEDLHDMVWIYHDNALEGEVLTPEDLRSALTHRVVAETDSSSTASLRTIRCHKAAIHLARQEARKLASARLDLLSLTKRLHEVLTPDSDDRPGKYRRESQLHRHYFHEIAEPNRISYLLRKLYSWLETEDAKLAHPVEIAARVHYEFIHIFPFDKNAGRVARTLLSHMVMVAGYPPVIIHANDRQRYYECFRLPEEHLVELVRESIESGIAAAHRKLDDPPQQSVRAPLRPGFR